MDCLRKILSFDNVRKIGIIVVEWFCIVNDGDLVDHLLLHCPVAYELWT